MEKKKTWSRLGLVGGLLLLSLVGARYGRTLGHAAGDDDDAAGCSAPQQIGATKGPSTQVAVAARRPGHSVRALMRRWHSHTSPTPNRSSVSPASGAEPGDTQ